MVAGPAASPTARRVTPPPRARRGVLVDDVHSASNATRVASVVRPANRDELAAAVRSAHDAGLTICLAGARHAMGGQQFAEGALLVDVRGLDRVLALDRDRGFVEVEAGASWPRLLEQLEALQPGEPQPWTFRQKQPGADALTLGGAVAANAHGRCLDAPPLVSDVESLTVMDARGIARRVDREHEPELFRLVVGGHGLFGVVVSVTLRLVRRARVRRVVDVIDACGLPDAFEAAVASGFTHGDFQFAVDPRSPDFLRRGVFARYRPVAPETPLTPRPRSLDAADWGRLLRLVHVAPSEAFRIYADHYLSTAGQVYASDRAQLSPYVDGYHRDVDRALGARVMGSEMITELSVPRERLGRLLEDVRRALLEEGAQPIYGTVRLVEADDETVLAWARGRTACLVVNLHVDHDAAGLAAARRRFRALIDVALGLGGTYYLTYHRWASAGQVEAAWPRLRSVLDAQRRRAGVAPFDSEWARHHRALLGVG